MPNIKEFIIDAILGGIILLVVMFVIVKFAEAILLFIVLALFLLGMAGFGWACRTVWSDLNLSWRFHYYWHQIKMKLGIDKD